MVPTCSMMVSIEGRSGVTKVFLANTLLSLYNNKHTNRRAKRHPSTGLAVRHRPLRRQQSDGGQRVGTGHGASVLEHRGGADVQPPLCAGRQSECHGDGEFGVLLVSEII